MSELISRIPLFESLGQDDLAKLLGAARSISVSAGDFLFRRGEQGDSLYIVESGLLEAVVDEGMQSEYSLQSFFPGEYFGEMALLARQARSASVRALVDSRLIELSDSQFSRLLEEKPSIAVHISRMLSKYLSKTTGSISRQRATISAVVHFGEKSGMSSIAAQLAESLQRHSRAIMVFLGSQDPDEPSEPFDLSRTLDRVKQHPSGCHCLSLGEESARKLDGQAIVSIINSLRAKYGHVSIWINHDEALRRVPLFAAFDRACVIGCPPFDNAGLHALVDALGKASNGIRVAILAPEGNPAFPMGKSAFPPIRLTENSGFDRLARALSGKTVGLALGSGTAQGLSHLGVMKALAEHGVPIDLIAGTSGGALYGSLVASGLHVDDAVNYIVRQTRRNLLDKIDFALPTRGLIRGRLVEKMLRNAIGDVCFPDLPIPLSAVAADLDTGEEVIIDEGPVVAGVRASISVPGIFEPYMMNGRSLVDGVVVNPLPVSVARGMGADIVIAVQVPAPGKLAMEAEARMKKNRRRTDYSIFSTLVRSHHFVGEMLAEKAASEADILIKPDVAGFGWREYRSAPDIIQAGFQSGLEALEKITARRAQ